MADSNIARPPVVIEFQPLGRRVSAARGDSILAASREAGIAVLSVCGGAGLCDSCRVRVLDGPVSPPNALERERLDAFDIDAGIRLACQARVLGPLRVEVLPDSIATDQRLQIESDLGAGLDGFESQRQQGTLGLAVDVGTTKIAAFLVDLCTGRTVAAEGGVNPQVNYGEDVISRIAYADATPEGASILHRAVTDAINALADRLCARAEADARRISEVVLVGNTVMHHLAVGLPVASLGRAPYAPVVIRSLDMPAADIGLLAATSARLHVPPNIAGYVGSDHIAVLTAVDACSPTSAAVTRLIVDIGTNTEVSLIVGERLLCCSCASGPAFEGAHISHGMRAAAGAIERVRVVDGEVRWQTIGGRPPIGICGSGILDTIAQLVAHGALDRHGGFRREHRLLTGHEGETVFVLAPRDVAGHNRDLAVTRADISEIQLAKAAVRAGIDTLLSRAGIDAMSVDEVIVAGAFGTYLDLASARRVGMLPDLPPSRFRQVGNAAGAGARQLLVSPQRRSAAACIATRAEHVDLTADASFMQRFSTALMFEC